MTDLAPDQDPDAKIEQARLWRDNGWTAHILKNEDDDGWAVAMTREGASEPALIGPWTMGRDKKNPKPLDVNAFNTLVKTSQRVCPPLRATTARNAAPEHCRDVQQRPHHGVARHRAG